MYVGGRRLTRFDCFTWLLLTSLLLTGIYADWVLFNWRQKPDVSGCEGFFFLSGVKGANSHSHIIQLGDFVPQLAAVVSSSNWRTLYICWTVSSSRLIHICCSKWETGTLIVDFGDFLGFDANKKTFNFAFNGHKWVIPDCGFKIRLPTTLTL